MEFSENLKDLMIEHNIDAQTLAIKLGIENSSIYKYLNGILPLVKNAVKIADYFDCSLNFLFGLDEMPKSTNFDSNYQPELFFERYTTLLKQQNISHYRLCKDTGVNSSSFWLWSKGSLPKLETLIKIATYLDCSIDYLVGRSDVIN